MKLVNIETSISSVESNHRHTHTYTHTHAHSHTHTVYKQVFCRCLLQHLFSSLPQSCFPNRHQTPEGSVGVQLKYNLEIVCSCVCTLIHTYFAASLKKLLINLAARCENHRIRVTQGFYFPPLCNQINWMTHNHHASFYIWRENIDCTFLVSTWWNSGSTVDSPRCWMCAGMHCIRPWKGNRGIATIVAQQDCHLFQVPPFGTESQYIQSKTPLSPLKMLTCLISPAAPVQCYNTLWLWC